MARLVSLALLAAALVTASCSEMAIDPPEFPMLYGIAGGRTESIDALSEQAADGDANAQHRLGVAYDTGRGVDEDHAEAVAWFLRAAEQGYAKSQYRLGVAYDSGRGVAEDHAEAVAWFLRAAEQEYAKAQHRLGVAYDTSRGVDEDHATAARWFRRAAEQGYAKSQYRLGVAYDIERGVDADPAQTAEWFRVAQDRAWAALWYRRAAEQGLAQAQYALGVANAEGASVPIDLIDAYKWLTLAAERGLEQATGERDEVARRMTATQIVRAQRLVRHWSPRSPAGAGDEAAVRFVQFALQRLGYPVGAVDGIAGPRTKGAIEAYQRNAGLAVDGAVMPALVDRLHADPT